MKTVAFPHSLLWLCSTLYYHYFIQINIVLNTTMTIDTVELSVVFSRHHITNSFFGTPFILAEKYVFVVVFPSFSQLLGWFNDGKNLHEENKMAKNISDIFHQAYFARGTWTLRYISVHFMSYFLSRIVLFYSELKWNIWTINLLAQQFSILIVTLIFFIFRIYNIFLSFFFSFRKRCFLFAAFH